MERLRNEAKDFRKLLSPLAKVYDGISQNQPTMKSQQLKRIYSELMDIGFRLSEIEEQDVDRTDIVDINKIIRQLKKNFYGLELLECSKIHLELQGLINDFEKLLEKESTK